MCFDKLFGSPKIPAIKPLPPAPTLQDEEIRQREAAERERLAQSGGTAATVKTDLAPSSIVGQRRVLLGV